MSLEGMMRKAKRQIKKREADLAAKGTTATKEQIKKNEAIEARNAPPISAAQHATIKETEAKRFPEPDEGIMCRQPGCGTLITGTLKDLETHRATHL
jgi:hypothetical protein